jgi:hypothetical protein
MSHTRRLAGVTAIGLAAGAAYGVSRWPRMTTWGATEQEVGSSQPGDEIVGHAKYRTTHAVTIDAPVEEVWPWLVQLGQGRGGMYSYDWLENLVGLEMHSADRIVPELQDLAVGDVISLVPKGTEPDLHFVVARLDPPYLLVLGPGTSREEALKTNLPYPSWTFRHSPLAGGRSRLLVRFQSDFRPSPLGWLTNKYALEPVHFVMERKMLLGIKQRAERAA